MPIACPVRYETLERVGGAHHLVLLRASDGSVAGLSEAAWDVRAPGIVRQQLTAVGHLPPSDLEADTPIDGEDRSVHLGVVGADHGCFRVRLIAVQLFNCWHVASNMFRGRDYEWADKPPG